MKNIILIIAVLLSGIAFSQERIIDGDNRPQDYFPQKGDYIFYNSLNDFEGIFIWEIESDKRVEIVLEKKKLCFEEGIKYCTQILVGSYEYENIGQLVVSKDNVLQKKEIRRSDIKNSPLQIMSIGNEKNKITLSINDSKKDKHIVGILTKLDNGKYSLKLKERSEGINIIRPGEEKQKGFTLPEEMILTKIN